MILDNQTVAFCGLVSIGLIFVLLFLYAILSRGANGIWSWAFSFGSIALGFGLLSTQNSLPVWISVFIANVVLMLGSASLIQSFRILLRQKVHLYFVASYLSLFYILIFLFTFIWESIQIRIMIFSLLSIFLTIEAILLKPSYCLNKESEKVMFFLKVLFSCYGFYSLFRLVMTLIDSPTSLLDPSLITSYVFLFANLLLVAVAFGVIVFLNAEFKDNLCKKNKALEVSNRDKDRFFSMIAHDLRTPIGNMATILEMLTNDTFYSSPDGQRAIRLLSQSSNMTFSLLENLLEWARSQNGDLQFYKKEINLNNLLDSLIKIHWPQAFSKDVEFEKKIATDLVVHFDEHALRTILYHLTSNALKYTSKGGKVIVEGYIEGGRLVIKVSDSGMGMDRTHLESLFTYNKYLSREGTAGEKGTGLGLLICKEFIEKSGGQIQITSFPNQGTTVQLYFSAE